MRLSIFLIMTIFSLTSFTSSIKRSDSKLYYDFQLDYYPQMRSIGYSCEEGAVFVFSGEFGEALQEIISATRSGKTIVKRFSGRTMESSGEYPTELKQCDLWIRIVISDTGELDSIEGHSYKGEEYSTLVDDLQCILDVSRIYPGLSDGVAVNTVLYYIVDEGDK